MPEQGGGARLSELEARWRVDRSPRVFLQLADELRRAGAHARALQVLQEGLAHHPESVSGRVALGRAQLESGDPAGAAETLERALARDPAQIVASKLLIETWIRMKDAARARERLDIYRILHERDGEIDDYERRISAMERSERLTAALELAAAQASEAATASATSSAPAESDSVSEPATAVFELERPSGIAPLPLLAGLVASGEPRIHRGREFGATPSALFGRLHEPVASGARILDFFRAQSVFAVPVVADAAPVGSSVALEAASFVEAEPEVASPAVPSSLELVLDSEPESLEIPTASAPAPAAPTPAPIERYSTTGFAAEIEAEERARPASPPEPIRAGQLEFAPTGELDEYDDTLEAPAPVDFDGAELFGEPSAAVPGGEDVSAAEPPSATLARLYLDQGHFAEAEAEYQRVLETRPDDTSAIDGLREVARKRSGDETVSGWRGAEAPPPPKPHRTIGLTQRKVETLRAYLDRIRRGRARAHVS